jgi:hypothetical protein
MGAAKVVSMRTNGKSAATARARAARMRRWALVARMEEGFIATPFSLKFAIRGMGRRSYDVGGRAE